MPPPARTGLAPVKPALVQDLAKRLQTWRTLQIENYADESLQSREYPLHSCRLRHGILYFGLHPK
jgi:hypothetical protein